MLQLVLISLILHFHLYFVESGNDYFSPVIKENGYNMVILCILWGNFSVIPHKMKGEYLSLSNGKVYAHVLFQDENGSFVLNLNWA